MKILLLNPLDKKNCAYFVVQPLGLMYIASALRSRFSHEIKILDMKVNYMTEEDALREIKSFAPDIIGIRVLTVEAAIVHELVEGIKESHPHCKVILGGPHISGSYRKVLNDSNVDFVVIGEGEETMCELIAEIEKGNDSPKTPGIGYLKNNEVVLTSPRNPILDLDSIPFPAWDLIDMESYFKLPSWNFHISRNMAIFTSRGCPFKCAYCHNIFGKKTRLRSPENVLREIETLYNLYGIKELKIIDDIFNIHRPRAMKICDLIVENRFNLEICFPNGLRGDIMDTALLKKLKQAGTYQITYAIETASPRLQKLINKNINLPKLKKVIEDTAEMGIFTKGFFMMGFPSETREEILATAQYAISSRLHWMSMFIVNPYLGTKLADMAVKMGIDLDDDRLDFSAGYRINPVQLSKVPMQEIKALQIKTFLKFFLNYRRLFSAYKCSSNHNQLFFYVYIFILRLILPGSKRDQCVRWFSIKMYNLTKYFNKMKSLFFDKQSTKPATDTSINTIG